MEEKRLWLLSKNVLWDVWWAQVNWQTVQHSRTVDRKRA